MVNAFCFSDGRFIPGDPLGMTAPERGDDEDRNYLSHKGYGLSQVVGDGCGLSYSLYEGRERDEWLVKFTTAGRPCYVHCETWPDLIALLGLLSGIVLAGLIHDGTDDRPPHLPVGEVETFVRPRRKKAGAT